MIECEYIAPSSLEAALRVLGDTSQPAIALAGGTQLLVHLRTDMMRPVMLVDLRHLDTLQYIRLDDYHIDIGAKTTLAQVETNPLIWRHVPLLTEMARQFGNPLVRAAATLGGNIASLTPVADAVVPLLALDASLLLQSVDNGERRQQIASFIKEYRQEKSHVHELITQVTIPVLLTNALSFYAKLGNRKAGAIPIASVASVITIEEQRIQKARIALGAITPLPLRATQAEAVLHNETLPLREKTREHCLAVLVTELREPLDDSVASAEYRVMMGKALVRKALHHLRFAEHDKQKKTREE